MNYSNNKEFDSSETEELDKWFNELDEQTIEIINKNLIKEEDSGSDTDIHNQPDELNKIIDGFKDSQFENNNTIEDLYIEDIISKDPNELSSYQAIQYECSIAYFIQVLMEGTQFNRIKTSKNHDCDLTLNKLTYIMNYLEWISKTCENLSKRINQQLLIYKPLQKLNKDTKKIEKPIIIRSSYNFCTKYTQCKNFYSKQEIPTCKEHHYVHSLLKYDIDSVIAYLDFIINNKIEISQDEYKNLYLSIKTICFVTRHMAKEISYIDYITKNNSELFHRNNPIDLHKKNKTQNKSNIIKSDKVQSLIKNNLHKSDEYPRINQTRINQIKLNHTRIGQTRKNEGYTFRQNNKYYKNKHRNSVKGGFKNINTITLNNISMQNNRYNILDNE